MAIDSSQGQERDLAIRAGDPSTKLTRTDLIPLVSFVAFFLLMFRSTLFGGHFMLIGDPLKQLYPLRTIAWDMIRSGHLPLWTPYIFSGYPMMSMVMLGIGYPVTWGYLFLPGHWAEQLYVLAPYLLAPIFTYLYLRELKRSTSASMLGGLAFGYSGFLFSTIGLTGVHANSAQWLPLLLLGIVRARRQRFLSPLLLSTAAYTMSVLAGSGQIFLYVGSLALAYGIFLALVPEESVGPRLRNRWQPFAVAAGAIALSVGLTAFQSLETWNAVKLSNRQSYPFARFSEGSFPLQLAVHSLLQPLGNFWDSSTFTPSLALILAIVALGAAFKRPRAYQQVFFWLIVAVIAWFLILGRYTPLFKLYSYLPLVGKFRYPSRHSLEWTFAIAVLAAYGWDVVERWGRARQSQTAVIVASGTVALTAAVVIAYAWGRMIVAQALGGISDLNGLITGLHHPYLGWKGGFTFATTVALCLFCRLSNVALRTVALTVTIALYCFVEPYLWVVRPLAPWTVPVEQFGSFGTATRVVQKLLGERERSYSVVSPYAIPSSPVRDLDAVNWTALAHLRDINGYESLIMQRYVNALRGVTGESFDTEPFINPHPGLFDPRSRVLDLLNVRYMTSYTDMSAGDAGRIDKDGITFSTRDLGIEVKRDTPFSLTASGAEADTLAVVSAMAMSGNVVEGTPVARLTIHDADGRVVERFLRAGADTSEWAYDRADVQATVLHSRAPIFDSGAMDPTDHFEPHRFVGRVALGERLRVTSIDFVKLVEQADIGLAKASLYDSVTKQSQPLPQLSPSRWQKVHDQNDVLIFRNLRALPPAWLVANVVVADKSEILRRILGASSAEFDPAETALVEMSAAEDPKLSGPPLSADAQVRITTYKPSRLVAETNSMQQTMLVLSEMYYPGWIAKVDGIATTVYPTDYLLRGILIPPGTHRVEMHYTAPGARKGGVISLATIALIGVMVGWRKGMKQTRRFLM